MTLHVPASLTTAQQKTIYSYSLSYRFENRGNEPINIVEEDLMVPRFMNTSHQTLYIEESTHSYTTTEMDIDGNYAILIDLDRELLPGEIDDFTITYRIESSGLSKPDFNLDEAEESDAIPDEFILDYTSPSETFMVDDEEIRKLSRSIVEGEETVLGKTLALLEYVIEETEYINFEYPLYPNQTLSGGQGDCDDQSILLISMLRSLGIPAYLQVGIVIMPSIKGSETNWEGHLTNNQDGVGWHGWAMVYIPPWGWVPVDLTLGQRDNPINLLKNAPEYSANIVTALNVSEQAYIGETLKTRDRIVDSELYITLTDKANRVSGNGLNNQSWLMLGLGGTTLVAIVLMFYFRD
ncbi:hypothetical protein GF319_02010 [Candidatus Bathyarchaeota archaeon]|nr:hypothetical protein [Candidatus Bathyarchaeota archaeon]